MAVYPIPGFADPISSITHLFACVVFAILSYRLLQRGCGHTGRMLALGVYAFTCVFLLAMSGTYHMLPAHSDARAVMQRLDHAAIFTLIAGTFTAAHAILFKGVWRWGVIALIWTLAVLGIVFKTVFFDELPELVGLGFYLGMGWIGIISGFKVWRLHGWRTFKPLLAGGLAYSIGAVFEFLRWPVLIQGILGPHEVFHVAVIFGVACHWTFVYRFADHAPGEAPLDLDRNRSASPATA